MSFENSIRTIVRPNSSGYHIADTDEIYNTEIVLSIDGSITQNDIELYNEPNRVMLSCQLQLEPIVSNAKLYSSDKKENISVYAGQLTAYKSASIVYTDFGKVIFSNGYVKNFFGQKFKRYSLNIPQMLYKQDFFHQCSDYTYNTPLGKVQLLPYGGKLANDHDICTLQQAFFHPRNTSENIGIIISDETFWRNKAVDPFIGGTVTGKALTKILAPPLCHKQKSLSNVITDGDINIRIASNDGEEFLLSSKYYRQKNDKLDIMFTLSET